MKFGAVPVTEAAGAYLGHTHRLADRTFKKGRRLTDADVARLAAAGFETVVVARLEAGDLHEDDAAARIAARAAGPNVAVEEASTGRANLFASMRGLIVVSASLVDEANLVDEAITIATLEPYRIVEPRDLVATVKIIPFGVPGTTVERVEAILAAPLVRIAPLVRRSVGLVLTALPGVKPEQLARAEANQGARLRALGSELQRVVRVEHAVEPVAAALHALAEDGCSPLLVLGASAITDRNDVVPEAIRAAGGEVTHVGMPVDPGNLLLLGELDEHPVIGVPGCARSLARSGFDRVLERVLAGVDVGRHDIMRMGVGGLMKDVEARSHPRRPEAIKPSYAIGAVVLAAGQSRRMGETNKLLTDIDGTPMVARVVDMLVEAKVTPIVVVVGHEADRVRAALGDRGVEIADNPAYAEGLSTSIRTGAGAIDGRVDGALFVLSDMPWVTAEHVEQLIARFDPDAGRAICVPVHEGRRGNPVLWASRFFLDMQKLTGDVGARPLLAEHAEYVHEVDVESRGVHFDVDTPEALAELERDASRERTPSH